MNSYRVLHGVLLLLLIAGCSDNENKEVSTDNSAGGGGSSAAEPPEVPDEEVTLTFAAPWDQDTFTNRVKNSVEEEFPHITLELIETIVGAQELEELFSNQVFPDILLAHRGFGVLDDAEMLYPLDDMIEQFGTDLSQFTPGMIDAVRALDPENEDRLLGLPIEERALVLYYNPDIFDYFGVSYPTDGMTWDEVIDLAERVTGNIDGVTIRGLSVPGIYPLEQLSAHGTDPETGEVLFTQEPAFAQWLNLVERIKTIPGNYAPETTGDFGAGEAAMHVFTSNNMISYLTYEGLTLRWSPCLAGRKCLRRTGLQRRTLFQLAHIQSTLRKHTVCLTFLPRKRLNYN